MKKVHTFFNDTDNYLLNNYNIEFRKKIIKNFLGELKDNYILDVGCGDGGLSLQYAAKNKIDFLDLSQNMLNIVEHKLNDNQLLSCRFLNGDFCKYRFDKKYDVIIFVGVLAHISSINKSVNKASELLKKNGVIIFQFTNNSNIFGKILQKFYSNSFLNNNNSHKLNKIKFNEFSQILGNSKLKIEEIKSHASLLPGMGRLSSNIRNSYQFKTLREYVSFIGTEIFIKVKLEK